jgi:HAMP domain-containing protein
VEKKTIVIDVKTAEGRAELEKLENAVGGLYDEVQPLTAQIGELEDQLYAMAQAGDNSSEQFKQMTAQVGKMKKVIIDVDMAVDGMSGTMSQKLGGSIQGLAGGFELVQGTMGAFGAESAKVEEALLKVNSAMAIAQGVQSVRESIPAFKALNAVIMSNPIGLIVTAFVALGAAAMYFATKANTEVLDAFKRSTAASEKYRLNLEKTAQQQNTTSEKAIKALDREGARRIAMGEDATKVQKEINDAKIKELEISVEQDKADIRSLNAQKEKLKETQKETKEKLVQQIIAARQALADDKLKMFTAVRMKEIADALTQIKEVDAEMNKQIQSTNASLTARNQELEASKDAIDSLKTSQIALNNQPEVKIDDAAAKQRQAELAAQAEMNAGKLALETTYLETKRAKTLENNNIDLDLLKEQTDKEAAVNEAARLAEAEKQKKADEAEKARKLNMMNMSLDATKSGLQGISDLVGAFAGKSIGAQKKAFNTQKKLNIAMATIDTIKGAVSAFTGMTAAVPGPVGLALGAVAAAGVVASGVANVKKITSTQFEGGGGVSASTGAGVSGSVGQASNPASFNVVGNSNTNQIMEGLNNQQPVKAYVVSGEVTSGQSLDRNQIKTATL